RPRCDARRRSGWQRLTDRHVADPRVSGATTAARPTCRTQAALGDPLGQDVVVVWLEGLAMSCGACEPPGRMEARAGSVRPLSTLEGCPGVIEARVPRAVPIRQPLAAPRSLVMLLRQARHAVALAWTLGRRLLDLPQPDRPQRGFSVA